MINTRPSHILLVCFTLILAYSCQTPVVEQSIEEFGQELIETLKDGSEPRFNEMLLDRSDLKKVFNYSNGKVKMSQAWDRYESKISDAYSQLANTENFATITLDSIEKQKPKKQGMNPISLLNEEKCEVATINVYYTTSEKAHKKMVLRNCIKLPETKWKVSIKPELKTIANR